MGRLILTWPARRDLVAIDGFLARASLSMRVAHEFTGVARPDLGDVRLLAHGNYLVLFRNGPDTVRVLRVTENHRDIAAQRLPDEG